MDNFKIFSFGDAGSNIANTLLLNKFDQSRLFNFNTDLSAIERSPLINKFQIGSELTSGMGTSADPNIGRQAFDEDLEIFKRLVKANSLYVIVGGLGGGTFTGMCGKITELLSAQKKNFLVIATMPFLHEGKKRESQAIDAIKEINQYTDRMILIKNSDLSKLFGDLNMGEALRKSDNVVCEIIKEILFEIDSAEIKRKESLPITQNMEDLILQIKSYIKSNEYLISTVSSKIIIADTNKELLKAIAIDSNLLHKISPRKFEELIEYVYRLSGYKTELTKTSRDDGADILLWTPPPVLGNPFLTVVQAKKYSSRNKVGSSEIRELIGTKIIFNADKAQIITTSDFSKPAIKTAKSAKIDLLKFYELNDTIKKLIE